MSVPPKQAHVAHEWFIKAAHDLKNAEHTLKLPDPECPLDTVCFHAQQCAEKSLKALLTLHSVEFQKIHDLEELLNLCAMYPKLIRELNEIDRLNPYAVEIRYPELWGEGIDRQKAKQAVALATKVYKAVHRKLAPYFGLKPKR